MLRTLILQLFIAGFTLCGAGFFALYIAEGEALQLATILGCIAAAGAFHVERERTKQSAYRQRT